MQWSEASPGIGTGSSPRRPLAARREGATCAGAFPRPLQERHFRIFRSSPSATNPTRPPSPNANSDERRCPQSLTRGPAQSSEFRRVLHRTVRKGPPGPTQQLPLYHPHPAAGLGQCTHRFDCGSNRLLPQPALQDGDGVIPSHCKAPSPSSGGGKGLLPAVKSSAERLVRTLFSFAGLEGRTDQLCGEALTTINDVVQSHVRRRPRSRILCCQCLAHAVSKSRSAPHSNFINPI